MRLNFTGLGKLINGSELLKRLKRDIDIRKQVYVVSREKDDVFKKLVAIILSQNTNDKNALKAYGNLEELIGVEPEKLVKAGREKIMEAIRVSGMYRQKSERIYNLAKMVQSGFNLEEIVDLDSEKARKKLMDLPGIGPKTADVLLAIYNHETIGIDTHINRIVKRLGLVPKKAKYEDIRSKLLELFKGLNYDTVHRYLIAHGRTYCLARNPKCEECPLNDICKYGRERT